MTVWMLVFRRPATGFLTSEAATSGPHSWNTHVPIRQRRVLLACLAALCLAVVALAVKGGGVQAQAASDRVLILAGTVSGGTGSIEATEATAQGLQVDVVDAATWSSMTATQFAAYRAIILGDPTCQGITSDEQAAAANAKTWGPTINGNIVITGTDPVFHAGSGGETLTRRAVDFAVAQTGKTGAYISLSCYYHDTGPSTPVPLLDGIGPGGFTVTGVGCYNNAHIVAEHAALAGLADADISNWSCSVHEAFQTWPGSLVPLAIARDFDSSYTASDGSQGPPYILAGGDIRSFPLSLTPLNGSAPAGTSHTVTAQLLDGVTRAPVVGAKIGFGVSSGPTIGTAGVCVPAACTTDSDGHVSWTYASRGSAGDDTIRAFYDSNGNGSADPGEPQTTAGMSWTLGAQRYVALGDSVPYGHGLANPTKGTKDGLPANQGPSKSAWPEYVDQHLSGFRPLSYRPTSCDLGGSGSTVYDQLAFSGAPSQANKYTGKDDNCRYPKGKPVPVHKAVVPEEIIAGDLRKAPPGLVTIQVGADDINFAGCLASVLGEPTLFGSDHCANRDGHGTLHASKRLATELSSLATGLSSMIDIIHGAAPAAQIMLANYYQIMPKADANLTGRTTICRDLRFAAKNSRFRRDAREIADFLQGELNGVIGKAAAKYSDVRLVDIAKLFAGHEMCTLDSWLFDEDWRAAHPTSVGQTYIGEAVVGECKVLARRCAGR